MLVSWRVFATITGLGGRNVSLQTTHFAEAGDSVEDY